MASPDELVRRAQAGERDALLRLVEREQAHVYTLAVALVRQPADAADATQETFARLLGSLGTFRGDGGAAFSTWLHRLTVNICLDALRRRRALLSLEWAAESAADSTPAFDPADTDTLTQPEQQALRNEAVIEVRAALAGLPGPQRIALSLHYFEDTSYAQVAATTGLPLNTVKSHILRGKARLARVLDGPRQAQRLQQAKQLQPVAA